MNWAAAPNKSQIILLPSLCFVFNKYTSRTTAGDALLLALLHELGGSGKDVQVGVALARHHHADVCARHQPLRCVLQGRQVVLVHPVDAAHRAAVHRCLMHTSGYYTVLVRDTDKMYVCVCVCVCERERERESMVPP
jgi:hypothetical protein